MAAAGAVIAFSLVQAADRGGGGADSPEEAVEAVAEALAEEDALAVLDLLPPDEVRSLPTLYLRAEERARRLDLTGEHGTFSGFDVTVEDLSLRTQRSSGNEAVLEVERGTLVIDVDPSQASRLLRPRLRETTVRRPLAGMTVTTVRHDGGWYVSWVRTLRPGGADPVGRLLDDATDFVDEFGEKDVLRLLRKIEGIVK